MPILIVVDWQGSKTRSKHLKTKEEREKESLYKFHFMKKSTCSICPSITPWSQSVIPATSAGVYNDFSNNHGNLFLQQGIHQLEMIPNLE